MEFFGAILKELGRVLVNYLTSPSFLFLYIILFALVAFQYRRLQTASESMLPCSKNVYLRAAAVSALLGLAGGVAGSVMLILLGVDLTGVPVGMLWLTAVLLMLIKPRFICFAYAAGLLSIISLVTGRPDIDVPQLMGLVGVLHLVESILIFISGSFCPWPVYINKDGRLRGGFNLQQFWPIPLVVLVAVGVIEPHGAILAPPWWPLLGGENSWGASQTYILLPVMAMLGYGEITTTKTPAAAVRTSSRHLLAYSAGLIGLAVLASHYSLLLPVVALYSPIGHELVIWLAMRAENGVPLYVPPRQGVMILDVLPGTPAYAQGLHSHDIILRAGGQSVNSYQEFLALSNQPGKTLLIQVARNREQFSRRLKIRENRPIGIIPVPEEGAQRYLCMADDGIFAAVAHLWRQIRYKLFTS
ncbi:MAG: PDZ domain-containing protein [Syntrophomonadaceae bacterium]